ncbi:hypothetical protein [Pedobacter sp. Leaf132]|uniref:hypothetical protein n=1 Tax=Pedobacter sp. Leaf132 TaxID=2876557 RepID=UPI001E5B94CA|nr:hypothetical protein [Pedobacter sp. Leaf132]
MAKSLKGYKAFRFGAIAADGGMGQVLTAIGATVKGSVTATTSEATTQDFNIEEQSQAFESVVTEEPQLSGVLEIYDVHPDTAIKIAGGTSASVGSGANKKKVYTPPAVYNPIEVSGELESKNGAILGVVRMQLLPVWQFNFQDSELGKLIINWKALAPTKADTGAWSLSVPDPA